MTTFVIAGAVFALAMLAMTVGVLLGRRPLRGSCGGLAGRMDAAGQPLCEACDNPSPACRGPDDPRPAATDGAN